MIKQIVIFTGVVALSLVACAGPGVPEAIGTGSDATPVVVGTSASAVTVENRAGRPLLNVRVAIDAAGAGAPFLRIIPSIEAGHTMTLPLAEFRTEEDATLDPAVTAPRQVTLTARDSLTKSYEVTVAWK